jgi:hypothetical protein
MNHDPQCPLCSEIKNTDNIKICQKHQIELCDLYLEIIIEQKDNDNK